MWGLKHEKTARDKYMYLSERKKAHALHSDIEWTSHTVIPEIFATILLMRSLQVCSASHLYENIADH